MNIHDESLTDEILDVDLSIVLARQLRVSLMTSMIAEQLYTARTLWLGDGALPWAHLTPRQQAGYRREVELLIKGDVEDIRQRNAWAEACEKRNGVK